MSDEHFHRELFELIEFRMQQALSESQLGLAVGPDLRWFADATGRGVIMALRAAVYGKRPESVVWYPPPVRYPRSWWQALKVRYPALQVFGDVRWSEYQPEPIEIPPLLTLYPEAGLRHKVLGRAVPYLETISVDSQTRGWLEPTYQEADEG